MEFFNTNDADEWFSRNATQLKNCNEDVISETLIHMFANYVTNHTKFLEIGCGDGSRTSQVVNAFSCYGAGVDLSPKAIAHGKNLFTNITLEQSDAKNFPFSSNEFNFVYLGFFLYLVDRHDYLRVLSEADRVLEVGGYLAILDFDVPSNYSNKYAPNPCLRSFKVNNSRVFTASGLYTLVAKSTFSHTSHKINANIDDRISLQLLRKESSF